MTLQILRSVTTRSCTRRTTQQANGVDDLLERGQSHPDCVNFGKSLKSLRPYTTGVCHFLACTDETTGGVEATKEQLLELLNSYFERQHVRLKDDGETAYYSPTVFRTWFSTFDKWLTHTGPVRGHGGLQLVCPVLYNKFKVWEDGYVEKHARTFKETEIKQLLSMVSTCSI